MCGCAARSPATAARIRSGHVYFSLKDEGARIEAVIWKGAFGRLRFKPEDGLEVIATGKITTYPGSSKYQIVIDEPRAGGRRRADGAAGGAQEEARRRRPVRRGAQEAAAVSAARHRRHHLAHRRGDPRHSASACPTAFRAMCWCGRCGCRARPARAEVAAAIAGFNALKPGGPIPRPDVLIVARGGGSLEDLWGFNEEIVARAAAASEIPLISAVGHETDWTLIDLVADRRAPTPTAAAEMIVPVRAELIAETEDLGARLIGAGAAFHRAAAQRGARARARHPGARCVACPAAAAVRFGRRAAAEGAARERARPSRAIRARSRRGTCRLRCAQESNAVASVINVSLIARERALDAFIEVRIARVEVLAAVARRARLSRRAGARVRAGARCGRRAGALGASGRGRGPARDRVRGWNRAGDRGRRQPRRSGAAAARAADRAVCSADAKVNSAGWQARVRRTMLRQPP